MNKDLISKMFTCVITHVDDWFIQRLLYQDQIRRHNVVVCKIKGFAIFTMCLTINLIRFEFSQKIFVFLETQVVFHFLRPSGRLMWTFSITKKEEKKHRSRLQLKPKILLSFIAINDSWISRQETKGKNLISDSLRKVPMEKWINLK